MSLVAISLGYIFQIFEDLQPKYTWIRICFDAFHSICGFPLEYKPKLIANRIYITFCVFGNLIFNISIVVFLMKALCSPIFYENQIESVREIVDMNFNLKGDYFTLRHLIKQNEVKLTIDMIIIETNLYEIKSQIYSFLGICRRIPCN